MVRTLDQAKRTAIMTAAKSIFIKDGYATAKMSDIAAEAGVAPGTLYLYFDSKETLASAIGEDFFTRLGTQLGSIARKIENPAGIISLVDWALRVADKDRAILAMAREHKGLKSAQKSRRRVVDQLAEALSDLMSQGTIRQYSDVETLADVVLAVLRRIIMAYAVFDDANTDELKATAVTMLQHALFDDAKLATSRPLKQKR